MNTKLRSIRFFFQRLIRGWDDAETWNIDSTVATFILPRLKRFAQLRIGHPSEISDAQWTKIIDQIIWSMEYISNENHYIITDKKDCKKLQDGLNLFGKWFLYLWW